MFFSRLKVISGAGMFFSRLSRVCSLKIFLLRWGCNICEFLRQIDESYFSSLPISIVGIKVIAKGLNFRLSLEKFLRCHSDNVFLQELLLSVLSFPDLSCLFKLPFLFSDEMG